MNILTENVLSNLPKDLIEKAHEMSDVYKYLYCIENLLRSFIDNHPNKSSIKIPSGPKKLIEGRKKEEQKHLWISIRGGSDLYYVDFNDLSDIILNNWDVFKPDFPSQTWIKGKLDDLTKIRNMIAHNSYVENDERALLSVYFNSISRQIGVTKINTTLNNLDPKTTENLFIDGLRNPRLWSYNEIYKGIDYPFDFPATLDVAPVLLKAFYNQTNIAFYIIYEHTKVALYPNIHTREYDDENGLIDFNPNQVHFQIGLYDIDKDGIDELFICAQDTERHLIKEGMVINVFKYYPPAFKPHANRPENWSLIGDFSYPEEKAFVNDFSIKIPRNLRGFYYQKSFVDGEFRETGNF